MFRGCTRRRLFFFYAAATICIPASLRSVQTKKADRVSKSARWDSNSEIVSDRDWSEFTSSFKAHNPAYEDFCAAKLSLSSNPREIGSQFEQDVFLARNIFAAKLIRGEPGFYIDSGANDAELLSNTLLFDVCFGWAGLCIEPDSKYHSGLREKRSCVLVPECISNVTQTLKFQPEGTGGKVEDGETAISVQCRNLADMLRTYSNTVTHIDLWSLDVEGYEMTVLESITWSAVSFTALLIETFWLSDRHVDRYLTERNFVKAHQLAIDSLYLHWAQASDWRPDLWEENWIMNEEFRERMREAGKLRSEY